MLFLQLKTDKSITLDERTRTWSYNISLLELVILLCGGDKDSQDQAKGEALAQQ